MNSRSARTTVRIIGVALASACMLAAVPAFAYDVPVPNDCTVNGVQLQGMTEASATATIISESTVPTLEQIPCTVGSRVFTFSPVLSLDVTTMLASAYDTATPFSGEIEAAYTLNAPSIATWVAGVGSSVNKSAVSARYYLSHGKLHLRKSRTGYRLNQSTARSALASALSSATAGSEVSTITLTGAILKPRIPTWRVGKAIVVDISQRRLRVYNAGRRIRTYRVAVGTSGHSTPRGSFRVIRKVKNPSWHNPGSGWAAGMPSVIGPGPSNPLGTRALYLNAPGIRIHGTSNRSSIGTAASHGCIRMLRENVEALYPIIAVGTPVYIVR